MDENAVSEVLAEILIVALVVIIAAIIGAMVFGLVPYLQNTKVVGITATRFNQSNITVTYSGGQNQGDLYWLNISVNGNFIRSMGTIGGTTPVIVGNSTLIPGRLPGRDHVVIVGSFSNGYQQVLIDTYV